MGTQTKALLRASWFERWLLIVALFGVLVLPIPAFAEFVFVVDDRSDAGDDNLGDALCHTAANKCTLRAAIQEINFFEPSCDIFDKVILRAGRHVLAPGSPPLVIGGSGWDVCVDIIGTGDNQGPNASIIDGNGGSGEIHDKRATSIFQVKPLGHLGLEGLTVTKGHVHFGGGGGVHNRQDLQVRNSLFTGNSTHGRGGAILNLGGSLHVLESTFVDNWSSPNSDSYVRAGGAIANVGGSVLMINATISDNEGRGSVRGDGGGILNMGGGVFQMNNTTIAFNSSGRRGGGIFNEDGSTLNFWNTIVSNNQDFYGTRGDSPDCVGSLDSLGYTLIRVKGRDCTVNAGPGDQAGSYSFPLEPKLAGLWNNGGASPTHALMSGSPAIDAGNPDPAGFGACEAFDQRFLSRPKDGPTGSFVFDGVAVCDLGAYEFGSPEIVIRDRRLTEGNSGTKNMAFNVNLSFPHVQKVTVYWSTANGTAKAGSDYEAVVGASLMFNPGEVSKTVVVKIIGDRAAEQNETFFVGLASASFGRIKDGSGLGTILNDD